MTPELSREEILKWLLTLRAGDFIAPTQRQIIRLCELALEAFTARDCAKQANTANLQPSTATTITGKSGF
jgi:hypothetical protein